MEKKEKIKFVRDLSKAIGEGIIQQIQNNTIPEDWDGHELRALLADRMNEDAKVSEIRTSPKSRRARNYRKTRTLL